MCLLDIAVLWACFHAFGHAPPQAVIVMCYFLGMLGNALPLPGGLHRLLPEGVRVFGNVAAVEHADPLDGGVDQRAFREILQELPVLRLRARGLKNSS